MQEIENILLPLIPMFSKVADLLIGIVTLLIMKFKWKQPNNDKLLSRLMEELEQRDKEIYRLHMEIKVWKHQHRKLANKT